MNQTTLKCIALAVATVALSVTALADLTNTVTLPANTALSLDTGATSSAGGDILWTGSALDFDGTAMGGSLAILDATGTTGYASVTQAELQELDELQVAKATPIPASSLPVGTVLGVITNGGNLAKVLVTAISSSSISLQYDTFGASGSSGPTITNVQNNSSLIPSGFPNSGVTPSTLFVIHGTGMATPGSAAVLENSMNGLPTTLNGASVSVTVNGVTTTPALYYAIPTQIAGVLPAATPVGTGTITVMYNNTSATAPIQVVSSALGIDVFNGSGVATDASTGALLSFVQSGKPGETIILWGTGLGADPGDSDTTYTSTPHQLPNVSLQFYVGGVQANIVYQGASVYPGVTVIGLTIPASAPTGCYVSVAGVVGSVVSNVVTLPIAANGGPCSDPEFGSTGTQISSLGGQGTVSAGTVFVVQSTTPGTTAGTTTVQSSADAIFDQVAGTSYLTGGQSSLGSCSLNQTATTGGTIPTVTGLNAGSITVTGPSESAVTLTSVPGVAGLYSAQLAAGAIPSSGGAFTFSGTGGSGTNSVGAFTATVNFPNPLLTWTNESAAATVNRAQGLNVTWAGGAAGSYVVISGSSTSSTVSGSYSCTAPQSAGQFTVPTYVLLGLPAGSGTTTVADTTNIGSFTASGINAGSAFGEVSFEVNSNYQ